MRGGEQSKAARRTSEFLAGLVGRDYARMRAVLAPSGGQITAAENLISDVPMLDAFFTAGLSG